MTMQLMINGESNLVPHAITISELLTQLGYESGFIAVAVNDEFVPKSEHATFTLSENATIDVVAPMQGG